MRQFAALCALALVSGLAMSSAGAWAGARSASLAVSLTIECVAQDEVAQCGDSQFLARKEVVDSPSPAFAGENGGEAFGAQPAAGGSTGSGSASASKRRVTVITY